MRELLTASYRGWCTAGYLLKGPHRALSPKPLLSYGGRAPDLARVSHGGNVKLAALNSVFPEQFRDINLLYLVSSGVSIQAEAWADACLCRKIPLVWNQNGVAHPGWLPHAYQGLNNRMARLFHRASFVVYQSRFCQQSADRMLGTFQGPSTIVYNAVDTNVFVPAPRPERERLELIVMGSQEPTSRVLCALEALRILLDRGVMSRLTIAGRLPWANADRQVADCIRRLDLKKHTVLHGPYLQKEAPALYQGADILLHLKYADPCPSVVIEGLSCGLPVVASDSGGLPELIADAGKLLPVPGDMKELYLPAPAAVAQAVMDIRLDLPRYAALARARAAAQFDINAWLTRHRDIFARVLGGSH